MYCPSCGKQIPENSTFCLYCGTKIAAPQPLDRSVVRQPKQVEWEYRDFVYEFLPPGQGLWAKLGSGAYSEAGAKLEFWQNAQRDITAELQKWIDEGWEPIGEVGSSCIEIKTSYSHRDKSPLYWILFLLFSIPTFGVLFLIALLARSYVAEPIRFVLQMRAPKGTKAPISSTTRIQSPTFPVPTSNQKALASSQQIEELGKAGRFEEAAQLLEDIYNKDPSTASKVAGFPYFVFQQTEPVSGYALLIHLAGIAGKRELALQFFRRMVELSPSSEIWKAKHAAQEAGIKKEAKEILEKQGISWKWYEQL